MRKQRSARNGRKPELEALESRDLLSTGIVLFEVPLPQPRIPVVIPSMPVGLDLSPNGPPRAFLAENPAAPPLLALEAHPVFGPEQAFSALTRHALLEQVSEQPQASPLPRPSLVGLAIFVVSEHAAHSGDPGPVGPPAVANPQSVAFSPSATPVLPMAAPFASSQDLALLSALDSIHHRFDFDFMHARDSVAKLSSDPSMLESNAGPDQTEGITALSGALAGAQALAGSNATASALATVTILPVRVTSFFNVESNHGVIEYGGLIRESLLELSRDSFPALLSKLVGPEFLSLGVTARATLFRSRISANLTPYPADLSTVLDSQEIPALPHAAGIIAEALPQDGRSLQEAIDQLLDRLPELDLGQFNDGSPARVVPYSLVLLGALVAAFAMRRRLWAKGTGAIASRERDSRESDDLMGFPELPGSWSTRVT